MITEKELLEAIRDCEKDPVTPSKRQILADLFIILDHLYPEEQKQQETRYTENYHSLPERADENILRTSGDSEFLMAINGRNPEKVWSVLDELLTVIKITNSALYYGVLRKLDE